MWNVSACKKTAHYHKQNGFFQDLHVKMLLKTKCVLAHRKRFIHLFAKTGIYNQVSHKHLKTMKQDLK